MARSKEPVDSTLAELIAIKRLLVFALLRSGANQKQIATALGVDQSHVSRMFPGGIGKPATKAAKSK
jgi:predicted XRE-type DNA-binding protein